MSWSPVRPDVTTVVTGNTEQRVTQTRNCTATSGRREGTKLWFNAMEEKTGDKGINRVSAQVAHSRMW